MRFNASKKGLALVVALATLALLVMAIPALIAMWSVRQLTSDLEPPPADLTIEAIAVGCHWRFAYRMPRGRIEIDAATTACTTNLCRMGFDSGKAAVVPVDRTVKVVVMSEAEMPRDFVVPTLGIRSRIVPGQVRETWFKALKTGLFIGLPSESCRNDPAGIAIGIRAVDAQEWKDWLDRTSAPTPDAVSPR